MNDFNGDIESTIDDLTERASEIMDTIDELDVAESVVKKGEKLQSWIERMKLEYEANGDQIDNEELMKSLEEFEEKIGSFEEFLSAQMLSNSFNEDIEDDIDYSDDDEDLDDDEFDDIEFETEEEEY